MKNAKGEIIWIVLMVVVGIVLSVLALGLATGENRFLGTFLGEYSPIDENGEEACGLVLYEPASGGDFMFPYTVSGKITGCGWSAFEGEVGWVEIIAGGQSVAQEPLSATSPWMAEVVNFEQNLNMPIINGNSATLRFHNTDPSGENALSVDIPVSL